MAGARGTEVMYKRESKQGMTTLTLQEKRYNLPSVSGQHGKGHAVDSEGVCVMMDVGMFCPQCTEAVQAQITGSQTKTSIFEGQGAASSHHISGIHTLPIIKRGHGRAVERPAAFRGSQDDSQDHHLLRRNATGTRGCVDERSLQISLQHHKNGSHSSPIHARHSEQRLGIVQRELGNTINALKDGSFEMSVPISKRESVDSAVGRSDHGSTSTSITERELDASLRSMHEAVQQLSSSDYESLDRDSQFSSMNSTETCIFNETADRPCTYQSSNRKLGDYQTRHHSLEFPKFRHKLQGSDSEMTVDTSRIRFQRNSDISEPVGNRGDAKLRVGRFGDDDISDVSEVFEEFQNEHYLARDKNVVNSGAAVRERKIQEMLGDGSIETHVKTNGKPPMPHGVQISANINLLTNELKQVFASRNKSEVERSSLDRSDKENVAVQEEQSQSLPAVDQRERSESPEFLLDEILENMDVTSYSGDATLGRIFSLKEDQDGHYPKLRRSNKKKKMSSLLYCDQGAQDIPLSTEETCVDIDIDTHGDTEMSPEEIFEEVVESLTDLEEQELAKELISDWMCDYGADQKKTGVGIVQRYDNLQREVLALSDIQKTLTVYDIQEYERAKYAKTVNSSVECIADDRTGGSEISLDTAASIINESASDGSNEYSMDDNMSSSECSTSGNMIDGQGDEAIERLIQNTKSLTENLMASFSESSKMQSSDDMDALRGENLRQSEGGGVNALVDYDMIFTKHPEKVMHICPPKSPTRGSAMFAKINKIPSVSVSSDINPDQSEHGLDNDDDDNNMQLDMGPVIQISLNCGDEHADDADLDEILSRNVDHASTSDLEEAYDYEMKSHAEISNSYGSNQLCVDSAKLVRVKKTTAENPSKSIPEEHFQDKKLDDVAMGLDSSSQESLSGGAASSDSDPELKVAKEFQKCLETDTIEVDEYVPQTSGHNAPPEMLYQAYETARLVSNLLGTHHVHRCPQSPSARQKKVVKEITDRDKTDYQATDDKGAALVVTIQGEERTEGDSKLASCDARDEISNDQAKQFIQYMLGDSVHVHEGSHSDISTCLDDVCQSCVEKAEPDDLVKSEEVITQEMTFVFAWPRKKGMQVHKGNQPFREVHLHRVTRVNELEAEVIEGPTMETIEQGRTVGKIDMITKKSIAYGSDGVEDEQANEKSSQKCITEDAPNHAANSASSNRLTNARMIGKQGACNEVRDTQAIANHEESDNISDQHIDHNVNVEDVLCQTSYPGVGINKLKEDRLVSNVTELIAISDSDKADSRPECINTDHNIAVSANELARVDGEHTEKLTDCCTTTDHERDLSSPEKFEHGTELPLGLPNRLDPEERQKHGNVTGDVQGAYAKQDESKTGWATTTLATEEVTHDSVARTDTSKASGVDVVDDSKQKVETNCSGEATEVSELETAGNMKTTTEIASKHAGEVKYTMNTSKDGRAEDPMQEIEERYSKGGEENGTEGFGITAEISNEEYIPKREYRAQSECIYSTDDGDEQMASPEVDIYEQTASECYDITDEDTNVIPQIEMLDLAHFSIVRPVDEIAYSEQPEKRIGYAAPSIGLASTESECVEASTAIPPQSVRRLSTLAQETAMWHILSANIHILNNSAAKVLLSLVLNSCLLEHFNFDESPVAFQSEDIIDATCHVSLEGLANAVTCVVRSFERGGPKAEDRGLGRILKDLSVLYPSVVKPTDVRRTRSESDVSAPPIFLIGDQRKTDFERVQSALYLSESRQPTSSTMLETLDKMGTLKEFSCFGYTFSVHRRCQSDILPGAPRARERRSMTVMGPRRRSILEVDTGRFFDIHNTVRYTHSRAKITQNMGSASIDFNTDQTRKRLVKRKDCAYQLQTRSLTVPSIQRMIDKAKVDTRRSLSVLGTVVDRADDNRLKEVVQGRCSSLEREIERRLLELSQMVDRYTREGTLQRDSSTDSVNSTLSLMDDQLHECCNLEEELSTTEVSLVNSPVPAAPQVEPSHIDCKVEDFQLGGPETRYFMAPKSIHVVADEIARLVVELAVADIEAYYSEKEARTGVKVLDKVPTTLKSSPGAVKEKGHPLRQGIDLNETDSSENHHRSVSHSHDINVGGESTVTGDAMLSHIQHQLDYTDAQDDPTEHSEEKHLKSRLGADEMSSEKNHCSTTESEMEDHCRPGDELMAYCDQLSCAILDMVYREVKDTSVTEDCMGRPQRPCTGPSYATNKPLSVFMEINSRDGSSASIETVTSEDSMASMDTVREAEQEIDIISEDEDSVEPVSDVEPNEKIIVLANAQSRRLSFAEMEQRTINTSNEEPGTINAVHVHCQRDEETRVAGIIAEDVKEDCPPDIDTKVEKESKKVAAWASIDCSHTGELSKASALAPSCTQGIRRVEPTESSESNTSSNASTVPEQGQDDSATYGTAQNMICIPERAMRQDESEFLVTISTRDDIPEVRDVSSVENEDSNVETHDGEEHYAAVVGKHVETPGTVCDGGECALEEDYSVIGMGKTELDFSHVLDISGFRDGSLWSDIMDAEESQNVAKRSSIADAFLEELLNEDDDDYEGIYSDDLIPFQREPCAKTSYERLLPDLLSSPCSEASLSRQRAPGAAGAAQINNDFPCNKYASAEIASEESDCLFSEEATVSNEGAYEGDESEDTDVSARATAGSPEDEEERIGGFDTCIQEFSTTAPMLHSFEAMLTRSRPKVRQKRPPKLQVRSSSLPTIREGTVLESRRKDPEQEYREKREKFLKAKYQHAKDAAQEQADVCDKLNSLKEDFGKLMEEVQVIREQCTAAQSAQKNISSILEDVYQPRKVDKKKDTERAASSSSTSQISPLKYQKRALSWGPSASGGKMESLAVSSDGATTCASSDTADVSEAGRERSRAKTGRHQSARPRSEPAMYSMYSSNVEMDRKPQPNKPKSGGRRNRNRNYPDGRWKSDYDIHVDAPDHRSRSYTSRHEYTYYDPHRPTQTHTDGFSRDRAMDNNSQVEVTEGPDPGNYRDSEYTGRRARVKRYRSKFYKKYCT